jgi:penicillin-binding protein 2
MQRKKPPITEAWRGITFTRRALVVGGAQAAVGIALAARMAYISIVDNDRYVLESESNRVNLTLVPPRRGWIVDRNGKALANNRVSLRIDIIPDRLHDKKLVLGQLETLLKLDGDAMERINRDLDAASGFQPVAVKEDVSETEYASVLVRLPDLPGIAPARGFARYYPTGAAVGHLVGYVGAPNAEEYQEAKDPLYITPGFKIGKQALEKYFEPVLRGKPGARRVEVTARGKVVRDLSTQPDVQGKTVHLTIDADLQHYAARRIGPESGSVVVIDCLTGDVLAMASMPSFDPNSFSSGIGVAEYKWLSQNDHVPLRNKTLSGLYPPGSTVKPMVAMSFLEAGLPATATTFCGGGLRVGNRVFHCWQRRGHGQVDMAKGIYQSCDVYFYHFAQQMGMDVIAAMAKRLGLGQTFPLPVPSQSYGTVPSPAWKLEKYGRPWTVADTVNATIGQGYMLFNPTQLAVMAARLATGNALMPHLTRDAHRPPVQSLGFAPDHIGLVREAMNQVVNGLGTAGRARLPIEDVKMAGKTGTAQVVSLSKGSGKGGLWKYRDHGLFIAFAPFDAPRYAAAVVIEHGGGSGAAYPIARDVMTYMFDRDKAMTALEGFETGWGGTIEERMARDFAIWKAGANRPPPEGAA